MKAGLAVVGTLAVATAVPSWPRFSWDTVPVFYHSCNFTGPYTADAVAVMAKFPMVTVEKGQGVQDATDPRRAEDKILEVLAAVKAVDANISTIFYYNSILDWPFYQLHHDFLQHPEWWVRDTQGAVCRMNGDGTFPNHTDMLSFDFTQEGARAFWASECYNMTQTGVVDGCFSDRSVGNPGKSCVLPNKTAFEAGHLLVHQQLQALIGDGPLIANAGLDMPGVNAVQLEGFKADNRSIALLLEAVAHGKITEAHAGYGEDGSADDHCSKGITNSLAAFLIGAGPRCYYACSRGWKVQEDPVADAWRPEYDKQLGAPKGAATLDHAAGVWTREFAAAAGTTTVTFAIKGGVGHIDWAGDPPTPAPTPPAPPAPAPGDCSAAQSGGLSGGDISPGGWHHDKVHTDDAAGCCAQCWNYTAPQLCTQWTWYSDGSKECHFHSNVATPDANDARVSGRIRA
jgi:hypothetical protein